MVRWKRFKSSQAVVVRTRYDLDSQKQLLEAKLIAGRSGVFDVSIKHDAESKLAYQPPPTAQWHETFDLRPANLNGYDWDPRERALVPTPKVVCSSPHRWSALIKSTLAGVPGDHSESKVDFRCPDCAATSTL